MNKACANYKSDNQSQNHGQIRKELKRLRKKIKKLTKQRDQNIKEQKRQIVRRYIPINLRAQQIIEGAMIQQPYQQSQQQEDYSSQINSQSGSYQSESGSICQKNEGISNYWKKVFQAAYQGSIQSCDQNLLNYFKSISVKQYSKTKITIVFSIKSGHKFIPEGSYERTLIRNQNSKCVQYAGESIMNCKRLKRSLFRIMLTPTRQQVCLRTIDQFVQLVSTQLIPKGLNYYLFKRQQQMQEQEEQSQSYSQNDSSPN